MIEAVPDGVPVAVHKGRLVSFVPVSFVAKDCKVSSRRIRVLLSGLRLEGRRCENGYWEVALPPPFHLRAAWPCLKTAAKGRTEDGMITFNNLTGARQIMNTEKGGTVSRAQSLSGLRKILHRYNELHLMPYTLW